MKKVVKFGGSSLASASQFKKVKKLLDADKNRKYIVVSAPGKVHDKGEKVTDLLYKTYDAINEGKSYKVPWKKIKEKYSEIINGLDLNMNLAYEFDKIEEALLGGAGRMFAASRGEYLNGLVMAEYLGWKFIDPVDGIVFNDDGTCNFKETDEELTQLLEHTDHAVIPGFYGADKHGNIVTFSRGGSDVTGALAAKAIRADVYENWTDVSGFLFADPRLVDNPVSIETITYSELRELAYMGASVMHEDAIFPVRTEGIPIHIMNTNRPDDPGTMIVESTVKIPKYTITGIAGKKGFCSINVDKAMMNSEVGFCMKVLDVFSRNGISIEHMPSGIDTMSVVVHQSEFESKEQQVIAGIHRAVSPDSVIMDSGIALIAVVGRAMKANRGTAGRIFSALAHAGVNIKMIDQGSSEQNIIIGVRNEDFETAIRALYDIYVNTAV